MRHGPARPLWNGPPPPVRKPTPGEPVWVQQNGPVQWSCELRFHGESFGWEAQILRDGELVIGRRFLLREQAVAWAEHERALLPPSARTLTAAE
jgi:hypothetical protein